MATFTGTDAEFRRLLEGVRDFEEKAATTAADVALAWVDALMARTPVWEGQTVRNFALGAGARPPGGEKSALGSGDPGPTNSMPLGVEPRRPINESAVRSEAARAVNRDKLVDYFIINNSSKWDLVENGSAPSPERARYPGGISILATQAMRNRFRGTVG